MYRLRSRIVNFRVTDEEFERLKTLSSANGARCLSDYARAVILGNAAGLACSESRIDAVEHRLSAVESDLAGLRDSGQR